MPTNDQDKDEAKAGNEATCNENMDAEAKTDPKEASEGCGDPTDDAKVQSESKSESKLSATQESNSSEAPVEMEEEEANKTDREVLQELFESTNGPGWNDKTNWCMQGTLDGWSGVTTDKDPITFEEGELLELDLAGNGLKGELPKAAFDLLFRLEKYDLTENTLTNVAKNTLMEAIVMKRTNLKGQTKLDFSRLELTGPIPSPLGSLASVRELRLQHNKLTGVLPLSVIRMKADKNRMVDLIDNEGFTLPSNIGDLKGEFTRLDLASCSIIGKLHESVGILTDLKQLILNNNAFKGPFPKSLCSLVNLRACHLHNNNFSGPFPLCLGAHKANGCDVMIDKGFELPQMEKDYNIWLDAIPDGKIPDKLDFSSLNLTGVLPLYLLQLMADGVTVLLSGNTPGFTLPDLVLPKPSLTGITELDLSDCSLHGAVPEFIHCEKLQKLNLQDNPNLEPVLPLSVGVLRARGCLVEIDPEYQLATSTKMVAKLQEEEFDFSSLKLVGGLPDFGECASMIKLDVSDNRLEGPIPSFDSCISLQDANFASNTLRGPMPSFMGCAGLSSVNFMNNGIEGTVPTALFNAFFCVQYYNMTGNAFDLDPHNTLKSILIEEFNNLKDQAVIELHHRCLTGNIKDLVACVSIEVLDLSCNSLTGPLPNFGQSCRFLTELILNANHLSGELPDLSEFKTLECLDVDNNWLCGEIPWATLRTLVGEHSLRRLHLSDNKFTVGEIPTTVGTMVQLEELGLAGLEYTGEIPDFSRCKNMKKLWLNSNRLSGFIPESLTECNQLVSLILCDNMIQKPSPDFSGCKDMKDLYLWTDM